ncbi:SLOG family protein [Sedimentibacter sp. MB31-C6]|uniref:SLOG family protein n=1 Tax=Sedimentibacter sp. MB31-C6 TaxID=3109366 RepID=UPI002DDD5C99|nr:SLOG family protein [Sedimentibacter sp. MB36-C1]WSI03572.1 SLOG family protein [Sedimentibacter sp. MB36-C1]
MIDKNKTICFSGHRTEKLPNSKEELGILCHMLFVEIDCSIAKGYNTFMFGGCYGFDLICAEQVLIRKQILKPADPINIKLIAVVPFEEQATRWNEYNRDKYYDILSKCDEVITLNKQYKSGCYHERNRYMVENSSKLICYYNGSDGGTRYTVDYAKKQLVLVLNLYDKCIKRVIQ